MLAIPMDCAEPPQDNYNGQPTIPTIPAVPTPTPSLQASLMSADNESNMEANSVDQEQNPVAGNSSSGNYPPRRCWILPCTGQELFLSHGYYQHRKSHHPQDDGYNYARSSGRLYWEVGCDGRPVDDLLAHQEAEHGKGSQVCLMWPKVHSPILIQSTSRQPNVQEKHACDGATDNTGVLAYNGATKCRGPSHPP